MLFLFLSFLCAIAFSLQKFHFPHSCLWIQCGAAFAPWPRPKSQAGWCMSGQLWRHLELHVTAAQCSQTFFSFWYSLSLSQCLPRSSLSPINHHFTHFIPRLLVSFTCPTLTVSLTSSFCLFRSTSDHSVVRNPGSYLLNYNTFININAVHVEQNPCIFVIFNRTVQLLRLSTDSPLFVTNFASGFDQNKHQRSSISVNDRSTLKHFICQFFSFLSFLTQMILLVRRDRVVQCDFRLFHEICQNKLIQTH